MTLAEQLEQDEDRRPRVYTDSVGKLTVGVGRNISDRPFSDDEIDLMLANDIAMVRLELSHFAWYAELDEVRRGVVENMAFNLGTGKLLHFPHLIAALACKDWPTAAAEMKDSVWAKQVGSRAQRLEKQITTGEWQ